MKILCEEEVKWKDERIHEREKNYLQYYKLNSPPNKSISFNGSYQLT